jgi:hypothetical protein
VVLPIVAEVEDVREFVAGLDLARLKVAREESLG